jgi:DNA (cytosine-5)-methyltransferase 1
MVAHSLRGDGFDASEDGTGRGTPLVPVAFVQNQRDEVRITEVVGALQSEAGMKQQTYLSVPVAFSAKDYGGDAMEGLSPTLRAGAFDKSHANGGVMPAVAFNWQGGGKQTTLGANTLGANTLGANTTQAVVIGTDMFNGAITGDVAATIGTPGSSVNASGPTVMQATAVRRLTPRECERLQGFPDNWTAIPYRGKPAADGPRYKALGNSWAVNCARWIGRRIEIVDGISQKDSA